MVFLNPVILVGLIAAVIPILIHLLNLKKLKTVEFSTLLFLKELQKSKVKKIKLKQWLLLALRVLIIIFLVGAFARPTVKTFSLVSSTSTAKTSSIIILDNSYSMSVVNERGSLFNQAKKVAEEILNNMQNGDEAAILLASNIKIDRSLLTTDRTRLLNILKNASVSYVKKSFAEAFTKAADIVKQSQNFNKEIYILSDFQSNEFPEGSDKISSLKNKLDKNTRIYTMNFKSGIVQNITNVNLLINNQIFELNKPIGFTSVIKNYTKNNVKNVLVSLFINGKRKGQTSVNLTSGETRYIGFETTLKESGLLKIFTEIESDDINQDNKFFTSIFVPKSINILLAYDNLSDSKFIELALQNNTTNNINIKKINLNHLDKYNLNKFDLIFIIGSENISNYSKLKRYVFGNGSLIIMPGSKSTLINYKKLCEELTVDTPTELVNDKNETLNQFNKIDLKHPIFLNLFRKNKNPQIDSPEFIKYFKIYPKVKGKLIISLVDDSIFLSEYEVRGGKILLFNSAPVISWNNFPYKGLFAPLINKSVFYLNSKIKEAKSVLAGEPIEINLRRITIPQIKVIRPDNSEEFINLNKNLTSKYLLFNKTELIGLYKFYSDNNLIDYATVNINPAESELKYLDNEAIFNKFEMIFGKQNISLNPNDNFIVKIYQSRFGTELWKYFLIIVLILALIEMFVSKSAKRELNDIQKGS